MKKNLTHLACLTLLCLLTGFSACKKDLNSSSRSQASNTSNASAVVSNSNDKSLTGITTFIPCANGGAGETVDLSGSLHITFHTTVNGNNFVSKYHFQPQGISGVGETTGTKYQATGETQEIFSGSFTNGTFEDTYTNNFRIVGQGAGNNYLVHENVHITVNANGQVTTTIDNLSIDCK